MAALAESPTYASIPGQLSLALALSGRRSRRRHACAALDSCEVQTNLEAAPTVFEDRRQYFDFVKTVIVRTHLERLPDTTLRDQYVSDLADQAANDAPPFLLDYWRLNLSAGKPQRKPS